MKAYIIKRIFQALLTMVGISIIVFSLTRISGDPVALMVPPEAKLADIEALRKSLGLDKPVYVQYWNYISGAARGDFGKSILYREPTIKIFLDKFPNTIQLALAAMAFALLLGIPVGIISAVKYNSWVDNFGKIFALLGQSLPVFWTGIMLILVFGVLLRIFPVSGMGSWKNLVMPAFTLGWAFTAALVRLTRSAMLDVLDTEYIKLARIKGVPEIQVITKHALKNAMIPIVTLATMNFIFMLTGTVITETVFAWPGVGRLVVSSISARDFPMIQTCVLIFSMMFVFGNLFTDLLYVYLDPRIVYQ